MVSLAVGMRGRLSSQLAMPRKQQQFRGAIMETDSEQLEHQARQARARMSLTAEQLRGRMSPGQLIDQLAGYTREGPAAEFTRNLGREIYENPLPLTLIGIGVIWAIIASSRSARVRAAYSEAARRRVAGLRMASALESRRGELPPREAEGARPQSGSLDVRTAETGV